MEPGEAREQARFIKYALPEHARAERQAGRARPVGAGAIRLGSALALGFRSARRRASSERDQWMPMLKDEAGLMALIVRSAKEARAAVQFYLDVELPSV